MARDVSKTAGCYRVYLQILESCLGQFWPAGGVRDGAQEMGRGRGREHLGQARLGPNMIGKESMERMERLADWDIVGRNLVGAGVMACFCEGWGAGQSREQGRARQGKEQGRAACTFRSVDSVDFIGGEGTC